MSGELWSFLDGPIAKQSALVALLTLRLCCSEYGSTSSFADALLDLSGADSPLFMVFVPFSL